MSRRIALKLASGYVMYAGMGGILATESSFDVAEVVEIGSVYEVIGDLYAHEVISNLDDRRVALIDLVPVRMSGRYILSRVIIRPGSRVRIVAKRERRWPPILFPDQFLVEVDSIVGVEGIPVVLGMSRGNEGPSGSLNPSIYRRVT
jgi:hypothetical protein